MFKLDSFSKYQANKPLSTTVQAFVTRKSRVAGTCNETRKKISFIRRWSLECQSTIDLRANNTCSLALLTGPEDNIQYSSIIR